MDKGQQKMSESSQRGRAFELKVQKIVRQKLHIDAKRDSRSGAGLHKQDVRDRYNELPLFIECKDHETIKPKAWWREADAKASYGQSPVVVFPDNEEVLCVIRFTDLLQLVKEVADWKETAESLRMPQEPVSSPRISDEVGRAQADINNSIGRAQHENISRRPNTCRNGHIADQWGYCMQLDCKYSRGYRPKKKSK